MEKKTTPAPLVASLALALLAALAVTARAETIDIDMSTPRYDRLAASIPADGGEIILSLDLVYDAKGAIVDAGTSTLNGEPVAVKGKLKGKNGVWTFKIGVKGATEKAKLAGEIGTGEMFVKYKGAAGSFSGVVAIMLAGPAFAVGCRVVLVPEIGCDGAIGGTATISSGFGNDSGEIGTVKGKYSAGRLSLAVAVGTQKIAFKGVLDGDSFVGTLKLKIPPEKRSLGDFAIADFVTPILETCLDGARQPDWFPALVGSAWEYDIEFSTAASTTAWSTRDEVTDELPDGDVVITTTRSDESTNTYQETFFRSFGGAVLIVGGVDHIDGVGDVSFENIFPHYLFLPDQFVPGYRSSRTFETDGGERIEVDVEVIGFETITLDIGTFTDCLRLRRTVRTELIGAPEEGSSTSTTDEWFGADVGLVKSDTVTVSIRGPHSSTTTTVKELTAFDIER